MATESAGSIGRHFASSRGLLTELENFIRQREVDTSTLKADSMVSLMVDWFRFSPMAQPGDSTTDDALVFRYGGWSEGCATAFKLSLLRRVGGRDAIDGRAELLAGITLMFEPSGQGELMPFATASSDWKTIDAFLAAVEHSPAFRGLGSATPMGVLLESGGLR